MIGQKFTLMKTVIAISIVLSISIFSSCTDSDSSISEPPRIESLISANDEMATRPSSAMKSYSTTSEESRIQISGSISLEVQNISVATEQIRGLVNQYNATIISSDLGNTYSKYAHITVLVPKTLFYELMQGIKDIGTKVTNENINSTDVTAEFVDIEARLNVMKQTEHRFITLLSETSTVEEIMSVERELMRLRGEIDSLEGRMKYLSKTTDNSILNVYITEEVPLTGSDWSFFDSLDDSVRALVSFSKDMANFLISLIVFSPIIIGIGFLTFFGNRFGKRYIRHRRK